MARTQVYHIVLRAETMRMGRLAMEQYLIEAQAVARTIAATGEYSTGRLARSIRKSGPTVSGDTITGSIGSRLSYAAAVERGAEVHNIFPKSAPHVYRFGPPRRPMLKFIWRGRTVYMHQIPGAPGTIGRSHPGQRGKHYIAKALVGVAARHNLRVVIFEV